MPTVNCLKFSILHCNFETINQISDVFISILKSTYWFYEPTPFSLIGNTNG